MVMTGANLANMQTLATKFGSTGAEFHTKSSSIVTRMSAAISVFEDQMRGFHARGTVLSGQMETYMTSLQALSNDTDWTGSNSAEENRILAEMTADMSSLRVAVDAFLGEAKTVVEGSLSQNMNAMSGEVAKYGTSALETSNSFAKAVNSQAAAIDTVMN